jgi:hypothetical protein
MCQQFCSGEKILRVAGLVVKYLKYIFLLKARSRSAKKNAAWIFLIQARKRKIRPVIQEQSCFMIQSVASNRTVGPLNP